MPQDKNSYVYSISGLFFNKGSLSETITEDIDEFVRVAPSMADNLRSSLNDRKDAYWFIQHMTMTKQLLAAVSAKYLQAEAENLLHSANRNNMEICRKKIEPFISDLLALSIEMQMAQKRAAQEQGDSGKLTAEAYTDIVNVLTAVSHLIVIDEFDKARELLPSFEAFEDTADINALVDALSAQDRENAEAQAGLLRDKFTAKLEELDGSREFGKKEVLAVDDRPDILRMVAGVLRERYKVLTATGGEGAIKILEKKTPDLFILDIDMPDMDGFELARRIRRLEAFKDTPILFLTSNSTREYVLKAIEAGGNDFIVKPAKHNILLSKVGRYLFA